MLVEYRGHLLVPKPMNDTRETWCCEIFLDIEQFKYFSIAPADRPQHRHKVVVGSDQSAAIQRAKDEITGQQSLFERF